MVKADQASGERRLCQPGTDSDSLVIDPELEALIPPPTEGEKAQLQRSLDNHGCLDALIVWASQDQLIVVDGHNRLRYCREKGIPFFVQPLPFADREAVKLYILQNQAGRRNLSALAVSCIRGQRYLQCKRQGRHTDLTSHQSDEKSTAERLGKEFGVSGITIQRDAQAARALERVAANCGVEAVRLLLARDSAVTHHAVLRLAQLSRRQQRRFLEQMKKNGGKMPRKPRSRRRPARISLPLQVPDIDRTLRRYLSTEELASLARMLQAVIEEEAQAAT